MGARELPPRRVQLVTRFAVGPRTPHVYVTGARREYRGDRAGSPEPLRIDDGQRGTLVRQSSRSAAGRKGAGADARLAQGQPSRGVPGALKTVAPLPSAHEIGAVDARADLRVQDRDSADRKPFQSGIAHRTEDCLLR